MKDEQGRRIFVLSLQGETLQVYTNSVEGQFFDDALCYFDGKLLAPFFHKACAYGDDGPWLSKSLSKNGIQDVVALCGV